MSERKIENLDAEARELTPEEAEATQGGLIGLLLPAVQKVRDAAARTSITDGTSNTITDGTSNTITDGTSSIKDGTSNTLL